jgi:4-hydroxy-tetrahydrodipicolinate synthase
MAMTNEASWLAGCIPDLPTPFDDEGAVDLAAFTTLCERHVAAGAPAIVVCETTGEASTLTPEERDSIIRTAVETAGGRTRVIAGAGSNCTGRAIELAKSADAAGADAVLSVVPYYNKPVQAGIEAHFRAVADSSCLPIILHDIPSRTIRELSDDTLGRLAESRQFVGLRDGTGDIARVMRLGQLLPAGFRLLSGDDATALAFVASGGSGSISMVSNVTPDQCQMIFSSCRQGRLQCARYLQGRIARLIAELSRESPASLKYALSLLDLMRPHTRLPITELDARAKDRIANVMAAIADEDLTGAEEA